MPSTSALLRVRVSTSGAVATVHLVGELDLSSAAPLRTRLSTVVGAEPPPRRVVLDVSGLHFVDASGISVLLASGRALAARGGELVLRRPSPAVRRVVELLALDEALPVER